MVYLWMECEGWHKFGPFLSLKINGDEILDGNNVIAARSPVENGSEPTWRTLGQFKDYEWRNPTIGGKKWKPVQE